MLVKKGGEQHDQIVAPEQADGIVIHAEVAADRVETIHQLGYRLVDEFRSEQRSSESLEDFVLPGERRKHGRSPLGKEQKQQQEQAAIDFLAGRLDRDEDATTFDAIARQLSNFGAHSISEKAWRKSVKGVLSGRERFEASLNKTVVAHRTRNMNPEEAALYTQRDQLQRRRHAYATAIASMLKSKRSRIESTDVSIRTKKRYETASEKYAQLLVQKASKGTPQQQHNEIAALPRSEAASFIETFDRVIGRHKLPLWRKLKDTASKVIGLSGPPEGYKHGIIIHDKQQRFTENLRHEVEETLVAELSATPRRYSPHVASPNAKIGTWKIAQEVTEAAREDYIDRAIVRREDANRRRNRAFIIGGAVAGVALTATAVFANSGNASGVEQAQPIERDASVTTKVQTPDTKQQKETAQTPTKKSKAIPAAAALPRAITVAPNDSITSILVKTAQKMDVTLSPEQSYPLYQQMQAEFEGNYFAPSSEVSVYVINDGPYAGDEALNSTGTAVYKTSVVRWIKKMLTAQQATR